MIYDDDDDDDDDDHDDDLDDNYGDGNEQEADNKKLTKIVVLPTVIATIAICLFPLWPSNIREYVWYLSVLAAAAVGSILLLALRKSLFCINIQIFPPEV